MTDRPDYAWTSTARGGVLVYAYQKPDKADSQVCARDVLCFLCDHGLVLRKISYYGHIMITIIIIYLVYRLTF